jgi:epoxyqueuosine reductase
VRPWTHERSRLFPEPFAKRKTARNHRTIMRQEWPMRSPPPTIVGPAAGALPAGAAWHEPPLAAIGAPASPSLANDIRDAALALGFARVGFCPIEPFDDAAHLLDDWLVAGHHGEMAYLAGTTRHDPRALLPGARSLIVVALPYARGPEAASADGGLIPLTGLIARYARGADYHGLLKERLRRLADRCAELSGRAVLARPCVDTAPLLEREAARRAGIGFTAKSSMTIVPGVGSYVLLGELLIDLELSPATPIASACGGCRACLDACPTAAFVDAYTLDARRCISYLTIELRGPIPRQLRHLIGRWVFGCDVCQEVCPFNHSPKPRPADARLQARPGLSDPDLVELLSITNSAHRRLVRDSALSRVSRPRLQRNAAVALGNTRRPEAVPALARALRDNPSALVRGHAAWALGRIGTQTAREVLTAQAGVEADAQVLEEIQFSIGEFLQ